MWGLPGDSDQDGRGGSGRATARLERQELFIKAGFEMVNTRV